MQQRKDVFLLKNTKVEFVCVTNDPKGIILSIKWSKQIRIGSSMSIEMKTVWLGLKYNRLRVSKIVKHQTSGKKHCMDSIVMECCPQMLSQTEIADKG